MHSPLGAIESPKLKMEPIYGTVCQTTFSNHSYLSQALHHLGRSSIRRTSTQSLMYFTVFFFFNEDDDDDDDDDLVHGPTWGRNPKMK